MNVAPCWVKSANLQHHQVEWPETTANDFVFRRKPGIAAEEHRVLFRAHDERGPQRGIAVFQSASGKMLRGCCSNREPGVRDAVRFPPIEFRNASKLHAPRFEMRADAERGDEGQVALGEFADGRVVEVIVVIM